MNYNSIIPDFTEQNNTAKHSLLKQLENLDLINEPLPNNYLDMLLDIEHDFSFANVDHTTAVNILTQLFKRLPDKKRICVFDTLYNIIKLLNM